MLILTRRPGEELVFTLTQDMPAGTRITMVFTRVQGNQVRFGVDAPRSISVDRAEVAAIKFGNPDAE